MVKKLFNVGCCYEKSILKDVIVFLVMLAVVAIVCCFCPDSIPIHFNAQGEANLFVNKWFLLLGTVIPYSVYFQFLRHGGKGNK